MYIMARETAGSQKGNNISIPGGLASNYESGTGGSWCDYGIGRAPVVTLAGGDLEQDGRDEAAVAVSGSVLNYNMAKAGHMTVYTYKDGGLVPIEGLNEVSLGDTDGRKQNYGMYAANCAFGRFKYPWIRSHGQRTYSWWILFEQFSICAEGI